ncbi:hypothetical protein Fmac_023474 [Flemingia macrophylla]|uniref:Uncharacterized protein n=1 Tax=Flemingia macrophylla TaxID=520843 RepID=A0ABD1LLL3_9FABA
MRNNCAALLLVSLLFVVALADDQSETDRKREDCNNYCYNACIYPAKFCRWWCGGRCENPIFWESLTDDVSKKYPVPKESDFSAYNKAHPPSSSHEEV